MNEVHVIFLGRVQGVGFRATVVEIAKRFSLMGTVRNCPDGSVEAVIQGKQSDIDAFLHALKQGNGAHRIAEVISKTKKSTKTYTSFEVIV